MAQGFEIKINGLKEIQDMVNKYPAVSEKHINKAIINSLIDIRTSAKNNAPFGSTGNLRSNWILKTKRFEGSLESGANNNGYQYGRVVEFGRTPGKGFDYTASSFLAWCKKRGLIPFLVMRSIKRKGIKGKPFFQPAIDSQESNINKYFGKALEDIIKEI